MSQFKKMVFKSTLLTHSVFEESQLESQISIAVYYHRQNNFINSVLSTGTMLLKINATCLLPTGRCGLTWFDWVPWTTW